MDEKAGLDAKGDRGENRRDGGCLGNQLRDRYAARKRGIAKDGVANGTEKVSFSPWISVAVVERGVSNEDSLWIAK